MRIEEKRKEEELRKKKKEDESLLAIASTEVATTVCDALSGSNDFWD